MEHLANIVEKGGDLAVAIVIFVSALWYLRGKIEKIETRFENKFESFEKTVKIHKDNLSHEFQVQKEDIKTRVDQAFGQNKNQYDKIDKNAAKTCEIETKMYKEMVSKDDLEHMVNGIIHGKRTD